VGRGFFPLDEELELLPGELTPCGQENLVRLSAWMPFSKASQILKDLLGIQVSKQVGRSCTEKAGAAYVQLQAEAVERLEQQAPKAPEGGEKMQISADGAMVPLRHGIWAEVRTLVVGEVGTRQGEVHTRNLSYFSRKENAETFNRLALVEIHRRGIENAVAVAAVMDGAEWEQGFTDHHCPKAVRILDFSHAAEHIAAIGASVYGENTPETHAWLKERLERLKHAGPDELLVACRNLQQQYPDQEAISSNLAYLEKRRSQMQYPQFQAQGWPIGSGVVESANKVVVEARMKGAGMHWADQNVNPLLALRNIICSDRWNEEWPKIEKHIRSQIASKRRKRAQERAYQKHLQHWQPLDEVLSAVPQNIPAQKKPNPWRNFKHGKALFQRTAPPKN